MLQKCIFGAETYYFLHQSKINRTFCGYYLKHFICSAQSMAHAELPPHWPHSTLKICFSKSDLSTTFFHKLVEFTFAPLGLQLRSSVANLLRVQVFPVQLSTSCHSYLYNFSELDLIVPADLQYNLFTLNHFKPENLFSLISSSWRKTHFMYL